LRESLLRQVNQLGLRSCKSAPWDDIGDAAAQVPTVYFPGFQQVDQLPEYYARASAFLHPAISEPWGLVINEAMASGLPVIASRNGGAVETLVVDDQNGWQFDPLDQAQMVDMMNQTATLSESDRRRMGEESRKLLEANMPSAAFGDGLVNCLRVAGALT
jgi:glycosyltransferase involved in cell wall biosynthesis